MARPAADQIARWLGAPAGAEADWSVACEVGRVQVDWRAWCAEWLPGFAAWAAASVTAALATLNATGLAPAPSALFAALALLLALAVGGLVVLFHTLTGDRALRRLARDRTGRCRLSAWGDRLRLESGAGAVDLAWDDLTGCDARRRLVLLSRGRRLRLFGGRGADAILEAVHRLRLAELGGRAVAAAEQKRLARLPAGALSRLTGDRAADERALSRVERGDN